MIRVQVECRGEKEVSVWKIDVTVCVPGPSTAPITHNSVHNLSLMTAFLPLFSSDIITLPSSLSLVGTVALSQCTSEYVRYDRYIQ
jgi:hypothetical protein